ncbi:MAG TPA: heme ABC exporter ATP-binding protein CcmA [Brevefilum fermentans]|jgi:heme exporter protein A|nr:heme ABC exporter ATP-binding protein CcmA [Chloroflexota bacterium]HPX96409.1 heme ABC exporter ATP-binding protein CcmA [Brevefilum fermentans]HQA29621.1 heme ABC exporter ATP-binding protein CcmA [Brevefilum fermentans]
MARMTFPPELLRIDVHGLVKRYHRHPVLNQLSLTINRGDFCLLVGDNGVGKTTLLRILAGLVRPSQGAVTLYGADGPSNPLVRREIGYVGHQPMVYQDLSAYENLLHSARLYPLENREARISQALQALGLVAHQHQPVRTLSRGLLQRLSLARATLHQPSILLFDEPYTSLDQEAAGFLDRFLQNWHRPDRIILLAAHRPQRLLTLASHVAWLKDGRIDVHIPVSALAESPELNSYLGEVT